MTKMGKDKSLKGLCIAAIYGKATLDNKYIFFKRRDTKSCKGVIFQADFSSIFLLDFQPLSTGPW